LLGSEQDMEINAWLHAELHHSFCLPIHRIKRMHRILVNGNTSPLQF